MKHKILSIGQDAVLLETRARILASRYESEIEDSSRALERLRQEHFDLLLVCHSTPHDEASAIICAAHEEFPHLYIVRLLSASSPFVAKPVAHRVVTVDFHPQQWIKAVDELLTSSAETFSHY